MEKENIYIVKITTLPEVDIDQLLDAVDNIFYVVDSEMVECYRG